MYFNSDKWYEDHINEQQQIIDLNIAIIKTHLQNQPTDIKQIRKLKLVRLNQIANS